MSKKAKVQISVKAGDLEVKLVSKNTVQIVTNHKDIIVGRDTLETLLDSIDSILYSYKEDFGDDSVFDTDRSNDEEDDD